MLKYLVIGVGDFLGALARYVLGTYIGSRYGSAFPYETFVINVSGSFLVGFILTFLAKSTASPYWRYLIPIGFIGAYTTFSTFEYETLRAVQDGQIAAGVVNVVLSNLVGFAAVWAGVVTGRIFG